MTPAVPEGSMFGKVKDFSTYAGVGTFLLYFFGYLALRFHITALGIVTDLGVLDERYLFAGARFVVFLAFCLPLVTMIGVPVVLLARLMSNRLRPAWKKRMESEFRRPAVLLWISLVLALTVIQTWMTACLYMFDLPLAARLPGPSWLDELLTKHDSIDLTFFFIELLLCAAAVCWPVIAASRLPLESRGMKALFGTAAVLAVLTVLLIPVNFGMVVMPYSMQRTTAIGKAPLAAGQQGWLLFEGKEWMTYFVKSSAGVSVVAVPVKEIDKIEVKGSDSLFDVLYGGSGGRK